MPRFGGRNSVATPLCTGGAQVARRLRTLPAQALTRSLHLSSDEDGDREKAGPRS
ncbi:hypothetical protein GCM10022380_89030 [Amycolatopsis tucumanensis]|uniref:Uncharacterized protein n=1 Tax=Amycolatopsis tucumanensis TaxID=401106 RepID=A0ABP7JX51_9PSEU